MSRLRSTLWDKFGQALQQFYSLGHNRALASRQRSLDDFFMLLTFSECVGLPNPYAFYLVDLLPDLLPRFHRWHCKMGLHRSLWDRMPCGCC